MTKVLKFGGASIQDVDSIKNVVSIIQSFKNQKLVVVFSAIANVTNMLEKVVDEFVKQDSNPLVTLNQIKEFHHNILIELFEFLTLLAKRPLKIILSFFLLTF